MDRSIALVCASNQNRSVEAHALFKKKGYNVSSYGTGSQCKLPGPSFDKPNIFPFGTPYAKMHEYLKAQNPELYKQNGILTMLERNMGVKPAPERWQETSNRFELVITFDKRVYDSVVEDIQQREPSDSLQAIHVINLPVKDTHDEATVGAIHALQLVKMIEERDEDWEDQMEEILGEFEQKTNRKGCCTVQRIAFLSEGVLLCSADGCFTSTQNKLECTEIDCNKCHYDVVQRTRCTIVQAK